jgi:hypothetical protein
LLAQEQKRDNKLEQDDIRKIAEILRFDSLFYDFTLNRVINYLQLMDEPPLFSSKQVAKIFVKDSLKIAADKEFLIPKVVHWLLQVVIHNKLNSEWFFEEIFILLKPAGTTKGGSLEIERYV